MVMVPTGCAGIVQSSSTEAQEGRSQAVLQVLAVAFNVNVVPSASTVQLPGCVPSQAQSL